MIRIDKNEQAILTALNKFLEIPSLRKRIETTARRLERKLEADPAATMTWAVLPLGRLSHSLPRTIYSAWVFVLRARTVTGAERHPNSRQRTHSWRGRANFQTSVDGRRWRANRMQSDPGARFDERWLSIPRGMWHRPVIGEEHWVVVSFHTAPAEELIEERPKPGTARGALRRLYLAS